MLSDGGVELVSPSQHLTHHNQVRLGHPGPISHPLLHLHNTQHQHRTEIHEITWHPHPNIEFHSKSENLMIEILGLGLTFRVFRNNHLEITA